MTRKEIKKLDKLWSKKVREIGYCERCGKRTGLQASHNFSRTAMSTRWKLENGTCLCVGCHLYWWHKEPLKAYEWLKKKIGTKEFTKLKKLNARTVKLKYEEVLKTLL